MNAITQFRSLSLFFSALGSEARQDIIVELAHSNRLTVNQIASTLKLSQPTTSHHLKILHNAGLVAIERNGKERIYYLTLLDQTKKLRSLVDTIEAKSCEKETKNDL